MPRKATRVRSVICPVMMSMIGRMISVPMASGKLSKSIATMIPPKDKMLVVNWIKPLDRIWLMVSLSLEMRLIRSPTRCLSW